MRIKIKTIIIATSPKKSRIKTKENYTRLIHYPEEKTRKHECTLPAKLFFLWPRCLQVLFFKASTVNVILLCKDLKLRKFQRKKARVIESYIFN